MKKFNMFSISGSRQFLMGFAALWIVLYHSEIAFSSVDSDGIAHFFYILDYYIYLFKSLGQTGVEIFLFLSAIGLYFSFSKTEDSVDFYKKRLARIIPTYLIFGLLYELLTFTSVKESIFNLLGINFILYGKRRYWYIFMAIFTYAIYPFLYKLEKNKGRWIYFPIILCFVLFNLFLSILSPLFFGNVEIALRRFPIFLLGCYFGKEVKNRKEYSAIIVLFAILGLFFSYQYLVYQEYTITTIYRYVNSIYALAIIILVSYFYDYFSNLFILNKIISVIEKCGNYSLEYYLGFDMMLILAKKITQKEGTVQTALLAFIMCTIFSAAAKKFIFEKRNKNRFLKKIGT